MICDATVGTPILQPVLQRADPMERPDFVIHSYTKDLAGTGTTTAGVCIGRNERMFIPKGDSVTATGPDGKPCVYRWDETLFWNVYYIKGAFLDADKAFEVINGMHTVEMRVLLKCINTLVLARALASHPAINVRCSAVEGNENYALRERQMFLGLPAPLFTIDLDTEMGRGISPPRVPALLRLPRTRLWPAGDAGAGEHGGRLPGADESLGAVGRRAARSRHLADDDPHLRWATRTRAACWRT